MTAYFDLIHRMQAFGLGDDHLKFELSSTDMSSWEGRAAQESARKLPLRGAGRVRNSQAAWNYSPKYVKLNLRGLHPSMMGADRSSLMLIIWKLREHESRIFEHGVPRRKERFAGFRKLVKVEDYSSLVTTMPLLGGMRSSHCTGPVSKDALCRSLSTS